MEVVAQLVRASVCGTEGRGFETRLPPKKSLSGTFFVLLRFQVSGSIPKLLPKLLPILRDPKKSLSGTFFVCTKWLVSFKLL